MFQGFRKALLVSLGVAMILGGLFLLARPYLLPREVPYQYIHVKAGPWEDFSEFRDREIHCGKDLSIHKYEVRLTSDRALMATFFTAEEKGGPPVIVHYEPYAPLPLLRLPVNHGLFQELCREIVKNTEQNALIVSWWDHSLRIKLFTGRAVLPDGFLEEPLFLPDSWSRYRRAISKYERHFWGTRTSRDSEKSFHKFMEIMLTSEEDAARTLRELGGGRPTYIVVDQKDILKLSQWAGDRFCIEFEDFAFSGNLHGTIKRVQERLREKGLADYMVEPIDRNTVRAYHLLHPEDQKSLLVRLLPFTSSNPFRLKYFKPRLQVSTLWVYELI